MPLDHIVISMMRSNKWINVLMLNSGESRNKVINVSANGIRWIERNCEQRLLLSEYFLINTEGVNSPGGGTGGEAGGSSGSSVNPGNTASSENDSCNVSNVRYLRSPEGDATLLGLSLQCVDDEALNNNTVEVGINPLQLRFDENTPIALHCGHCATELVPMRRYGPVAIPVCTMEAASYFCPKNKTPLIPSENEIFYGLNHIVINPRLFEGCVTQNRMHVHCNSCLQQLGDILGDGVALQLWADTLCIGRLNADGTPSQYLMELFRPVTSVQLMLRLLHDAVPISFEQTRLFLKTVRPDGQLLYLLLLIDTHQIHLLRSKLALTSDLHGPQQQPRALIYHVEGHSIQDIELNGYKGCRINYQTFFSDEELKANHDLISLWQEMGTPMLRISHKMMVELVSDLNMNERLVMNLEKLSPADMDGRTSYLIYELDSEIFEKKQLQNMSGSRRF
ncbi:uncharacterized protein LOC115629626 [Scaptodrosophila lebanonensis]|uniref:Uncharacterized protein LOC115629626 n=1 Tax=Drosophila lebanonensis TaxID=7225 RepID=A0A6J2U3E4_DROLE|nr:uncharacterized protein LOC115629626 [Scaptodrosophila lebanonensis]XP_030381988.1 uncharacterized protein LOC115629626 [Scaptodrosophila lebanonensis]